MTYLIITSRNRFAHIFLEKPGMSCCGRPRRGCRISLIHCRTHIQVKIHCSLHISLTHLVLNIYTESTFIHTSRYCMASTGFAPVILTNCAIKSSFSDSICGEIFIPLHASRMFSVRHFILLSVCWFYSVRSKPLIGQLTALYACTVDPESFKADVRQIENIVFSNIFALV